MIYEWNEAKRLSNLVKHGLDFVDADQVMGSPYAWILDSPRRNEVRKQAFAYVFEWLCVLTVVFVPGPGRCRIVSFRAAKKLEREKYHAWLEEGFHYTDDE